MIAYDRRYIYYLHIFNNSGRRSDSKGRPILFASRSRTTQTLLNFLSILCAPEVIDRSGENTVHLYDACRH